MPAKQRGSVVKRGSKWGVRYYDENGVRRSPSGFPTKTAAAEWLTAKLDEIAALRRGEAIPVANRPQTVDALLDLFLAKHGATVDPATHRKLTRQLRQARAEFGSRRPDSINRLEVEDWRATLSPGARHDVFRAFRQALTWAHARSLTDRNATAGIANPKRKRHERRAITPFESWDEIEAVADELDPRYRAIPVFATGTGLRPEEWIALERGDLDRERRVVHVRRRFTGGELKDGTKTGAERVVPLRRRVLDALDAMPPRIDTRLLFPAPRGGYIDLERFRHREWAPALRAAGLDRRGPYTMRHTFATWAIESGVQLAHLAVIMGTSVRELEDTYFRWLRRTDDALRAAFDAYDAAAIG
ncbi:MAG: tyrosine-type recombinase/integrase [Rhodospirillales bacterium]|nr:tyrosine-type recombinase/integrase [Rhodospirillales bacterium]